LIRIRVWQLIWPQANAGVVVLLSGIGRPFATFARWFSEAKAASEPISLSVPTNAAHWAGLEGRVSSSKLHLYQ